MSSTEQTRANKNTARLRGGGLEEATLRAVMHLRGDGYGINIREELQKALGRELTLGAIYTTLDRLEEKGFVESRWSESEKTRGGRRKQLFEITGSGVAALSEVEESQMRMRAAFSGGNLIPEG